MKITSWLTCTMLLVFISCKKPVTEKNTYFENGNLQRRTVYTLPSDTSQRRVYEYFRNGYLKSLTEYNKGILDGRNFTYYEKGGIQSVYYFSHGGLNSIGRFYNQEGKITDKGLFLNDSMVVKEEFYYTDNRIEVNVFSKEGNEFSEVGQLLYDNNNRIGLDNSFYYLAASLDSIRFDDSLKVEVNFIARKNNEPHIALSLGKLNENLEFLTKERTLISDSLALTFYYKPKQVGYNLILGKLLFITAIPKEQVREFIFFHDFIAY